MAFSVEINPSLLLNVSNAGITLVAEGPNGAPGWTSPGDTPTNFIITTQQNLTVKAEWDVAGPITAFLAGVQWRGQVFVEQMGTGESFPGTFSASTPHIAVAAPTHYTLNVVVPATLPAGVYRLVFALTAANGLIPLPVAGFQDLGLFQIYRD